MITNLDWLKPEKLMFENGKIKNIFGVIC